MKRLWPRLVTIGWTSVVLASGVAQAATFPVAAGDVAGLVAAIAAANANGEPDVIDLASSTFTLTERDNLVFEEEGGSVDHANGLPIITSEITIQGNGSTIVRDPSAKRFRILHLRTGAKLTLNDLTISGGRWRRGAGIFVEDSNVSLALNGCVLSGHRTGQRRGRGAGIEVRGDFVTLSLDGTQVTGNGTPFLGGGINVAGNSLTASIVDSEISNNTTSGEGGGISLNGNAFDVTLRRSAVNGNKAIRASGIADGGGIGISGALGVLRVVNSAIDGNEVRTGPDSFCCGGYGGGIANNSSNTIVLKGSTISNNSVHTDTNGATAAGGGIAEEAGSGGGFVTKVLVTNSTISGNTVTSTSGAARGGGIKADGGFATFRLRNVTVTANTAGVGGGIATEENVVATSDVHLYNTVLAGNTATTGSDCGGLNGGAVISHGYNLFSSLAGCTVNGDTTGNSTADPMLGPLTDNGGPTRTHLPLTGSPAIDTGNPAAPGSGGSACDAKDQRGVGRPVGAVCDRGATEQ